MMSDPDSLGAALARQKWILAGCVGLSLGLAHVATLFTPPQYRAEARVMVDQAAHTLPALNSEVEIIKSPAFIVPVVEGLGLQNDPEFTGDSIANTGGFLSLSVGQKKDISPRVIESFQERLTVRAIAGSFVMSVSFVSIDPEKAARIATSLAQAYIESSSSSSPASQADTGALQDALARRDELARRYGPRHPRMIAIESEISRLRDVASAGSSARPAMPREGARLVSEAFVPQTPLRMAPSWVYALAPFAGLMMGLLLAGLNEKLDRGVKTSRDLEAMTGLPVAGPVPLAKDSKAALVLQKPASATAEAVRGLRASIRLLGERQARPIKMVTVTSSDEADQRALLGLWLGRLAARSGEKVLVVDANLRQPQLHALLGRSNTPSLVDYLTGQNYLEQVIWKQDASGAHMMFASSVPNTALDLVGSDKMKKLCGYLRQGYDLVVIIAPACLVSADAAVLANESDQAVYMVTAKSTDRAHLAKGLKLFEGFGYQSLSLVMTDPKLPA